MIRLKGGSLFYAIAVSLIIFLMSGAILFFSTFQQFHYQKLQKSFLYNQLAYENVKLALGDTGVFSAINDITTHHLPQKYTVSHECSSKPWGVYKLITSKAFTPLDTFKLSAISGYSPPEHENTALMLQEHNKELKWDGEVVIIGDRFIPKKGFKRSYHSFADKEKELHLEGSGFKSPDKLPDLIIKQLLLDYASLTKHAGENTLFFPEDSIHQPFHKPLTSLYSENNITLSGYYSGHVIIHSLKKIIIESDAIIHNVICIAPNIEVKSHFSGICQLIATDTITLDTETSLQFPSSINLISEDPSKSMIRIGANSTIEGSIIYWADKTPRKAEPCVHIEENTTIKGKVYVRGKVECKGQINGFLMADMFVHSSKSSIEENTIINTHIERRSGQRELCGAPLDFERKKTEIIQWVNQ